MTRAFNGVAAIAFAVLLFGSAVEMAVAASIGGSEFEITRIVSADEGIQVDVADDDAEWSLYRKLNEERIREGREPLTRSAELDRLARQKAWDMVHHRYFDHVSPTLGTIFDMLHSSGIAYKWAGENIARVSSVEVAHEAFMESPDHRANILSAGYTEVGVGVVRAGGKLYVCQVFMMPRAAMTSS